MLDVPVGVFQAFQIVFIRVSRKHAAVVHQNIDRHIHTDPFELTVGLLQQHLNGTAALFAFRRRQIIVKILIQCIHRLHHVGAVDRVAVADLLQYIYAGLALFTYYKLKGKISDRADRNRYRNQHAQQTGRYHALRHFAAFASAKQHTPYPISLFFLQCARSSAIFLRCRILSIAPLLLLYRKYGKNAHSYLSSKNVHFDQFYQIPKRSYCSGSASCAAIQRFICSMQCRSSASSCSGCSCA